MMKPFLLITTIVLGTFAFNFDYTAIAADATAAESASVTKGEPKSLLGTKVANFVLTDSAGKSVALSDFDDKPAVVLYFLGTGCPIANLYIPELGELQQRYEKDGLKIVGVNSNAGTTVDELRNHSEEFKLGFPALLDGNGRVAELLRASRTAEVFLLDKQRVVRYHGRVDDRFGYTYKNATPSRHDLEEAIKDLLAGKDVAVAETKALGCLITRPRTADAQSQVTYAKQISRIFERRCVECHRPGLIGPFSLLTYEEAVKHTDMMKEVVLQGRMPPWHADPRYGHWSNSRQMPQDEVDMLVAWIDAGAPFGDKNDLPPAKEYAEGWTIEKPDIVFELPEEVTVKAEGAVPYQYYKVPTKFEKDVLIQAAEARPGNRAVVHHIIVFYRTPGKGNVRRDGQICGTAPGDPPLVLPPGVALRIPAGAELLFQMHYTPTGKVEKDRSQVGLVLYKGEMPPKGYAKSKGIMNVRFKIPPGEASHPVESSHTFEQDVKLFSLMPHMHLRGKDFIYKATFPDGTSETLLSVPRYDFNWQNSYRFATPKPMPKGTRIDCYAHFDNSADNPANPDATKTVRWGDQTWEEMMIGWVGYVPDQEMPAAETETDDNDESVE
jgi:peroxiredoxin